MWRHDPVQVAERIKGLLPHVRLLAIVRNPVDRAQSALVHHVRRERLRPGTRLVEVARSIPPEQEWLGLIAGGWYAASLSPYRDRFGDQLSVLIHDDLSVDPIAVYRSACSHVGAAGDFLPADLAAVVHSNQSERSDQLSAAEREGLFGYFRDDVHRLEDMLDRDLSFWEPPPAGAPAPGDARGVVRT
jgi:hypothetical protein